MFCDKRADSQPNCTVAYDLMEWLHAHTQSVCGLSDPDSKLKLVPPITFVHGPRSIGAHVVVEGTEVLMEASLYVRLKIHHLWADKDLVRVGYGGCIVTCRVILEETDMHACKDV